MSPASCGKLPAPTAGACKRSKRALRFLSERVFLFQAQHVPPRQPAPVEEQPQRQKQPRGFLHPPGNQTGPGQRYMQAHTISDPYRQNRHSHPHPQRLWAVGTGFKIFPSHIPDSSARREQPYNPIQRYPLPTGTNQADPMSSGRPIQLCTRVIMPQSSAPTPPLTAAHTISRRVVLWGAVYSGP